MKKILLFLALASVGFAQVVPVNVQKTSGTNAITADLVIGSGRTISATGTGVVNATSIGGSSVPTLASGMAAFFGTPSSANLAATLTDKTGTGLAVFATSPVFATDITLPNGTSPTTGSVAKIAFDTNAWATSFGAIQVFNGTANTYVVAAQASDTPTNGQVPTWNTGGTITWETPSGGGGSPGGSNTQLQYNNSSAFGGISGATTNGSAVTFSSGNLISTSPRIITAINDTNGNELFVLTATSSAVNEIAYANAATGTNPTFTASGGDSDVGINLAAKGNGIFKLSSGSTGNGIVQIDASSGPAFSELKFAISGTDKGYIGSTTTTDAIVTGTVSGDMALRAQAASILFSTDSGTSAGLKIVASTGQVSAEKTTTSTSPSTGALISKGGLGVAENLNVGGTITPNQTAGIVGTTTNNDANAGSFGEYVHSEVAVGSAVSLTTNTGTNITSISLTAGDWEVSGNANFSASTATVTGTSGGISSTSATVPTDGTEVYSGVQVTLLSETDSVTLPPKRFSLSGTTTVYLVGKSIFSAGSVGGFGSIKARRVR